ncbi:hypothetical protein HOLleu_43995 [Holothuria leucospilota]|uniref:DUF7869 domain-containing protein n=1 Tax=Holothuria leucospilota TaxID=206669 RepID=A0A9Q0YGC7_HOLLE|nr:hypothetical protein HOLleu_43995 [Holothuria leucospilota]
MNLDSFDDFELSLSSHKSIPSSTPIKKPPGSSVRPTHCLNIENLSGLIDDVDISDALYQSVSISSPSSFTNQGEHSGSPVDNSDDNLNLYLSLSESDAESDDVSKCESLTQNRPSAGTFGQQSLLCSSHKARKSKHIPNPVEVLSEKCCNDNCLHQLRYVNILECQREMSSRNEAQQKQFIMDAIKTHSFVSTIGRKEVVSSNFVINGNNVCPKGWCLAHNVSDWRFSQVLRAFKMNKTKVVHGNQKLLSVKQEKTNCSLAWMTCLFKRMGDYMPHKDVVHLPHTWTKRYLYERMRQELQQFGSDVISYVHFTRIWTEHLSQFVISKSSDFTKCSTCTQLDDQYQDAGSEEVRHKIIKLREAHDKQVELERRAYHNARNTARREANEMTTIIIDGMDQTKTNVPHFIVQDKDNAHLAQLPVHFTGVLVHTDTADGKIPFIFYDIKHVPHDSNLTIHCLTEALLRTKHHLGKVIFIQLDNCFRENKNKFVFSFLAMLVEMKIFKEVSQN